MNCAFASKKRKKLKNYISFSTKTGYNTYSIIHERGNFYPKMDYKMRKRAGYCRRLKKCPGSRTGKPEKTNGGQNNNREWRLTYERAYEHGNGRNYHQHRCNRHLCRQCGCGVFRYCRYGCSKYERRSGKTFEERQSQTWNQRYIK